MRVAAIDAGTNTFRLMIADVDNNQFKPIHSDRVIVRLGEGLRKGLLSGSPLERGVKVLNSFASKLNELGVDKVNCVGTEVFRLSMNRKEIIKLIRDVSGLNLRVISGIREGELTLKGVQAALKLKTGNYAILDIGGGSSELIMCGNNKRERVASIDFGVVFFAKKIRRFKSETEGLKKYKNFFKEKLSRNVRKTDVEKSAPLIGTAGTITTIAALLQGLKKYDPLKINGFVIKKDAMEKLKEKLLLMPLGERAGVPGIEEGRKDLILPGICMMEVVFEYFGGNYMTVSDGGLLEGLLFE